MLTKINKLFSLVVVLLLWSFCVPIYAQVGIVTQIGTASIDRTTLEWPKSTLDSGNLKFTTQSSKANNEFNFLIGPKYVLKNGIELMLLGSYMVYGGKSDLITFEDNMIDSPVRSYYSQTTKSKSKQPLTVLQLSIGKTTKIKKVQIGIYGTIRYRKIGELNELTFTKMYEGPIMEEKNLISFTEQTRNKNSWNQYYGMLTTNLLLPLIKERVYVGMSFNVGYQYEKATVKGSIIQKMTILPPPSYPNNIPTVKYHFADTYISKFQNVNFITEPLITIKYEF